MRLQSPLRRWDIVAGFCQQAQAKICVEIGCKEGKLTRFVLENVPGVCMVAVDPWDQVPENPAESYKIWNWDEIENGFWEAVSPFRERVRMKQMRSLEAVKDFDDESVDIVFIDGAHDYDNVYADIAAWWPKVKPSGFLMGHDYQHKFPGVHRAVADHFNLLRVAIMADSVWAVPKNGGIKL